ncbi:MAG: TIGR03621 family F420-dependent LLM class oxidoreductase [Actinomycetota bacterium]
MSERPFRFGFQETASADPDAIRRAAQSAEACGFGEYWSSDHVGAADPFLPLQFAADVAPTLDVGPLVLNNEFHHPVMVARSVATLDNLTNGRAVLGLGTGYAQAEHDATAIPLRPRGARVTRFGESFRIIRELLDTGSCTFESEHHQIDLDDLGVRPVQERVPMLIGGHGRRVVTLAGQLADRFQFTGLTFDQAGNLSPAGFAPGQLDIRRDWLVEAAGDRIDDIERSALVQRLSIGNDTDELRAETAERWSMSTDDLDNCPFALIGSVEQVIDKIGRIRERLGITHYVMRDTEQFAPVIERL